MLTKSSQSDFNVLQNNLVRIHCSRTLEKILITKWDGGKKNSTPTSVSNAMTEHHIRGDLALGSDKGTVPPTHSSHIFHLACVYIKIFFPKSSNFYTELPSTEWVVKIVMFLCSCSNNCLCPEDPNSPTLPKSTTNSTQVHQLYPGHLLHPGHQL